MEKTFTCILAMCLCGTSAMAQNGSPYWSTSGNNNAVGTSKLGTTNTISLHFFTNNIQRMYIDSANGRVGIGVMSPQDRLHVNSASGENAFRAQVGGVTKLLVSSNGGTALGSNVTPPSSGLYVFGNTGLGNTSPTYKLQVKGDIAIDSGVYRLGGDPVLKYNVPNQSISLGNSGGTGTRLNTAVGYQALNNNTVGQANVALGHKALYSDNSGYSNIAVGSHALYSNATGNQLIAIGDSALYFNTSGLNLTAIGSKVLFSNTSGYYNVGIGYQASYSNTTGSFNVAIGDYAAYYNTTSTQNTAVGYNSMYTNTGSGSNTALGAYSGYYASTNSTFIGWDTYGSSAGVTNSTALGYHAPTTADNQVRVGDANVTSIGGQVGWSSFSDGRFKKNIKENIPGLTFINQLRPISYNVDAEGYDNALSALTKRPDKQNGNQQRSTTESAALTAKSKIVYTGFIAQEVEATAKKISYDFSGVDAPKNSNDFYGLRYADFVPPLVKAVQELSKQIDSLQNQINQLKSSTLNSSSTGYSPTIATKSITLSSAAILQNVPNPFTNNTTIQYSLPSGYSNAMIVIMDKSGKTLKTVSLNGSNSGNINVETSTLSAGAYQYSLIVDGRLAGTKQMLLSR